MTSPAADKTAEDQRGQNGQGKKDEASVDSATLKRVHGLGRFDRRNRPAHDPPLDDVSHHEQIEEDKHRRAPAARF